jgi:hypothetical protein
VSWGGSSRATDGARNVQGRYPREDGAGSWRPQSVGLRWILGGQVAGAERSEAPPLILKKQHIRPFTAFSSGRQALAPAVGCLKVLSGCYQRDSTFGVL